MIIGLSLLAGCSPRLSPDSGWGYQRWVLVEMKEVPVQLSGGRKDAYIEFFPDEKRFTGNGGCNQLDGNYVIEKKDIIQFSNILHTEMSCPDLAFENTLLEQLEKVNRFELVENNLMLKNDHEILLIYQRR